MENSKTKLYSHTIGAIFVFIVVWLICLYIIHPIVNKIFDWVGRYLMPARFGGGSESDNPGMLTLLFRGSVIMYVSAYASFSASEWFEASSRKAVAIVSGVFMLLMALVFTASFIGSDGTVALLVAIPFLPALFCAYQVFSNEG